MTPPVEAPRWWIDLQRAYGLWLRMPLVIRDGAFAAPVEAIDPALRSAIVDDGPGATARLALYHEQYWARLFVTFQAAFRRVARALGPWTFNQLVTAHLAGRSLASFDLGDAATEFFPDLRTGLFAVVGARTGALVETPLSSLPVAPGALGPLLATVDVPWSLVSQALALDEAERRAFRAPLEPAWRPSEAERAALSGLRMSAAAGFSLVKTNWALFDADGPCPRLSTPEHVVVFRTDTGIASQRVDAVFARLLSLAAKAPLAEAMVQIESASPVAVRGEVSALLASQVERAIHAGWWTRAP